jgi:hypothetical protein
MTTPKQGVGESAMVKRINFMENLLTRLFAGEASTAASE